MAIEREVDRVLNLLRAKIHEQGFTQLKVQRALGWGRTYISQLFRKQKSLRFDQILQILGVIEIDPSDFFSEFYRLPRQEPGVRPLGPTPLKSHLGPGEDAADLLANLEHHDPRMVVHSLVQLLVDQGVLSGSELKMVIQSNSKHYSLEKPHH
jgi:transcriptional regulator with XRE-family HTH domain